MERVSGPKTCHAVYLDNCGLAGAESVIEQGVDPCWMVVGPLRVPSQASQLLQAGAALSGIAPAAQQVVVDAGQFEQRALVGALPAQALDRHVHVQ